ncbi:hypothetical protein [Bacillus sp. AP8]|nr:hypothetical protein [Bacillus sp. AP8]
MLKVEFEMYNAASKIEEVDEELFYNYQHLDDMFRTRVRGIEHCIQVIDHLQFVQAEKHCLESLNNNDIRGIYKAVSNPARELVEAALHLHKETLNHSKTTHETSDLLKTIYGLTPVSNGL